MRFINTWPFLLIPEDRPGQQVGGGTEHREARLEQSSRREAVWGCRYEGLGNLLNFKLQPGLSARRIPANFSLQKQGFGLPEVVSSPNIL